jgi:curved DNA-binding protein CbpA
MNRTENQRSPWSILGVPPEADDEQIRAAYLRKVKEHPPDRSATEFENIRDAYDQLKDPYRRARHLILGATPDMPLESLLEDAPRSRRFIGPDAWLATMKSERKETQK